jgi:hypothetical protein
MHTTLAEVIDTQSQIIKLQGDIIDRLAVELMQHGEIAEENLGLMKEAAKMREGLMD